jgi:Protein of unknown function (DUF2789)
MHTMSALFEQLGLPSDPTAIEAFIDAHRPLDTATRLYQAPFWNKAQRAFLRDEILEDADWALIIDELDAELRGH